MPILFLEAFSKSSKVFLKFLKTLYNLGEKAKSAIGFFLNSLKSSTFLPLFIEESQQILGSFLEFFS